MLMMKINFIVNDVDHYDQSTKEQVCTTTAKFNTTTIDVELHTMSITVDDFGTHCDQNMVPNNQNCSQNGDFETHYNQYANQDDDPDHTITIENEFDTTTCTTIDDSTTATIESHTTMSATIYNITTTVVDDKNALPIKVLLKKMLIIMIEVPKNKLILLPNCQIRYYYY